MISTAGRVLRFAEFEMDCKAQELRREGARVRVQLQPFRVLQVLIENAGQAVSREELRNEVWSENVYVDFDHGLNNAIARLREALGDSAEDPRFIETLPRVGYRFVFPAANIHVVSSDVAGAAAFDTTPGIRPLPATDGDAALSAGLWRGPRRNLAVIGIVVFAAIAGLAVLFSGDGPGRGGGDAMPIRSIAVLPLRDLSEDTDQAHFAAGMTSALITRLAQDESLRVVSRRAGASYADALVPLAEIARELGVDAVIDGSLFRAGDTLQIDIQLVRAADDGHGWARSYSRNVEHVMGLQRMLADDIATEILGDEVVLAGLASVPRSDNLQAYELYLQGRHLWNQRSPDSVKRSVELFLHAIELDPGFAAAFAGLAEAYALLGGRSLVKIMPVEEVRGPAMAAARRAVELDEALPEAHFAMARAIGLQAPGTDGDREQEAHYLRAIRLNPAHSDGLLAYGNFLSARGRHEEAIERFREALLHDPLSANSTSRLGKELVDAGLPEEGIPLLERAVELEPWQFNGLLRLAWTYAAYGRFDEAAKSFERADQVTPGTVHTLAGFTFLAALRGDTDSAVRQLGELAARNDIIELPQLLAAIYAALGDREQAITWLEQAATDGMLRVQGLYGLAGPIYDGLRDDPRFLGIVQSVAGSRKSIDQ